jgi:hypothetical protein
VSGIVGARVDDRQPFVRADEIGLGAGIGERRAVGREHAADERFEVFAQAGRPGARGERHPDPMPVPRVEVEWC